MTTLIASKAKMKKGGGVEINYESPHLVTIATVSPDEMQGAQQADEGGGGIKFETPPLSCQRQPLVFLPKRWLKPQSVAIENAMTIKRTFVEILFFDTWRNGFGIFYAMFLLILYLKLFFFYYFFKKILRGK